MSNKVTTNQENTRKRRRACSRHLLLRVSQASQRFDQLDALLGYVTRLIRVLMGAGGAAVILPDAAARELYFQAASDGDAAVGSKLKDLRFPMDQGPAGEVYRTGKPIVLDAHASGPGTLDMVDGYPDRQTFNALAVPLRINERIIGVLQAVNKRQAGFDARDVELLGAVADVLALRIENARLDAALQEADQQVGQLREARTQVIHHLSHELKTPLAVLSASLRLLEKGLVRTGEPKWPPIHERIERNLLRLLDVEYKLEDILRAGDEVRLDAAIPACFEGDKSNEASK